MIHYEQQAEAANTENDLTASRISRSCFAICLFESYASSVTLIPNDTAISILDLKGGLVQVPSSPSWSLALCNITTSSVFYLTLDGVIVGPEVPLGFSS